MNRPETIVEIVILTIAVIVVAADVFARIIVFPNQRDKFVGQLLDCLMEPVAVTDVQQAPNPHPILCENLQEPLLRHFERSSASRRILSTLADGKAMTPKELLTVLNQSLAERGKPPLPVAVARRVATTLLQAGLVGVEREELRITELGQNLNVLLQGRKKAAQQLALSS